MSYFELRMNAVSLCSLVEAFLQSFVSASFSWVRAICKLGAAHMKGGCDPYVSWVQPIRMLGAWEDYPNQKKNTGRATLPC